MEPEELTVSEGEITYDNIVLEEAAQELGVIEINIDDELKEAENYMEVIYDNGNLNESAQQEVRSIGQEILRQSREFAESLGGLKNFLTSIKNKYSEAEVQIQARLEEWLNKFRMQKPGTPGEVVTDNPVEEVPIDRAVVEEAIKELDANGNVTTERIITKYDENGNPIYEVENLDSTPFQTTAKGPIGSYIEKRDAMDKVMEQYDKDGGKFVTGTQNYEDYNRINDSMNPAEQLAYVFHQANNNPNGVHVPTPKDVNHAMKFLVNENDIKNAVDSAKKVGNDLKTNFSNITNTINENIKNNTTSFTDSINKMFKK